MNTPSPNNLLPDAYRVHSRPRPGILLLLTFLANAFLSLILYAISMKGSLFDYSLSSTSIGHSPGVERFSITNGETQFWIITDQRTLWDDKGTDGNCLVSSRFPPAILQWCELITHYANKRGLPPDLLAALIWQESGGDPLAYSNSGAVGLMQVMPRDGLAASFICTNGPCFGSRPTTQELQDPEYNIAYGTKLLAGLIGRHGDLREALKFYGPKDVGYYYADKVFSLFRIYGEHSS
jgi:hypothetical protein